MLSLAQRVIEPPPEIGNHFNSLGTCSSVKFRHSDDHEVLLPCNTTNMMPEILVRNLKCGQCAYLEHLTGTFAVRARDDGCLYIQEAVLLEEGVCGRCQRVADPSHGPCTEEYSPQSHQTHLRMLPVQYTGL